jgi:hypothetical protein
MTNYCYIKKKSRKDDAKEQWTKVRLSFHCCCLTRNNHVSVATSLCHWFTLYSIYA